MYGCSTRYEVVLFFLASRKKEKWFVHFICNLDIECDARCNFGSFAHFICIRHTSILLGIALHCESCYEWLWQYTCFLQLESINEVLIYMHLISFETRSKFPSLCLGFEWYEFEYISTNKEESHSISTHVLWHNLHFVLYNLDICWQKGAHLGCSDHHHLLFILQKFRKFGVLFKWKVQYISCLDAKDFDRNISIIFFNVNPRLLYTKHPFNVSNLSW